MTGFGALLLLSLITVAASLLIPVLLLICLFTVGPLLAILGLFAGSRPD